MRYYYKFKHPHLNFIVIVMYCCYKIEGIWVVEALNKRYRSLDPTEGYVKWFKEGNLKNLLDYLDNSSDYFKLSDDEVIEEFKKLMLTELKK